MIMSNFNDIDLYITESGDLMLDSDGDLATVTDVDYVTQTVINRLKSCSSDWFYDETGADVEVSIGQKNTYENTEALVDRIISSMTKDEFCSIEDLVVIAKPITNTSVLLLISVNIPFADTVNFKLELNFLTGYKITIV